MTKTTQRTVNDLDGKIAFVTGVAALGGALDCGPHLDLVRRR
jgi:hypothetical protein